MREIWESPAHLNCTPEQKKRYNQNYKEIFGKKKRREGRKLIYRNGKWTEEEL